MSAEVGRVPGGRRERILVVDGDALDRNIAEQILRNYGYRPLGAASLSEALLACGMVGGDVDLAIVDVSNTGLRGEQVVARLRDRYPHLRSVFVGSRAAATRTDAPPLAPVVMTPFGVSTLLKTIRATLESQ